MLMKEKQHLAAIYMPGPGDEPAVQICALVSESDQQSLGHRSQLLGHSTSKGASFYLFIKYIF